MLSLQLVALSRRGRTMRSGLPPVALTGLKIWVVSGGAAELMEDGGCLKSTVSGTPQKGALALCPSCNSPSDHRKMRRFASHVFLTTVPQAHGKGASRSGAESFETASWNKTFCPQEIYASCCVTLKKRLQTCYLNQMPQTHVRHCQTCFTSCVKGRCPDEGVARPVWVLSTCTSGDKANGA